MRYGILLLLVGILLVAGCSEPIQEETLFTKIEAGESGILFKNTVTEDTLFNSINYLYFYDGGGVAVGDINNDGLSDIYLTGNMVKNRLYLNRGNMQFVDVTEPAGVGGPLNSWITGTTMADVNADGWLDIYICSSNYLDKSGPNQLYINNQDGTFTEKAAEYGLDFQGLSRQAAFFDYDLDGDLDAYLLNHSVHSKKTYGSVEDLRPITDPEAGDRLYRNEGGKFVDVTEESGIYSSILGYGLGIAVGDVNLDGYPDVYIANDFHEDDYHYYNNGDGTFREALRESMPHTSMASMGNDIADINNDGLPDIIVLDMLADDETIRQSSVSADPLTNYQTKINFGYYYQFRRNTLQLNRGAAQKQTGKTPVHLFSDIAQLAGVHATDWSWASLMADFDNDGNKDIFISNGIYRRPNDLDYLRFIEQNRRRIETGGRNGIQLPTPVSMELVNEILPYMPSVPQQNGVFRSNGNLTFEDVANSWGLGEPVFSSGSAYADLDNDGDLDLILNNVNSGASLFRNDLNTKSSDSTRSWLSIQLKGSKLNPFGTGAKVTVFANSKQFMQEQFPTRGFQSSVDPVLVFGLGDVTRVDSLHIRWATGEEQTLLNLPVFGRIRLQQSEAELTSKPQPTATKSILADITDSIEIDYAHEENTFIEFNREPFIPHFVSTEGPAVAVADVNGDGLDDLFLGGAKFQAGTIYLQNSNGGFDKTDLPDLEADSRSEDVDAVFFDADGNGTIDLYVASGGNEFFAKAAPLLDRLYLNDGTGNFKRSEKRLPALHANTAKVVAEDFDADGDIDIFAGSRSVPRTYGIIPESYLLINDGSGTFSEQTNALAPGLQKAGLITDAISADLNADGQPDLVLAGEWMPVRTFLNSNGTFEEQTTSAGLADQSGWWYSLSAADFNSDGIMDIAAGNLGLNSILKASTTAPVELWVHDFSGNGQLEQLLTRSKNGQAYPLIDSEKILTSIPALQQKYLSFSEFAGKSVQEMFTASELKEADVLQVNTFASTLFTGNKDGSYTKALLPVTAQFSPIHALFADDVNNDGHIDLLSAGNMFGTPTERGRYDASYGELLLGNGKGIFNSTSLQQSGIAVSGEVRFIKRLQISTTDTAYLMARNNSSLVLFSPQN